MLSKKIRPWAFSLILLASTAIADKTWWVDDSCKDKFKDDIFDKMMEETIETAKLAKDRMSRTREQEPQAYDAFEAIFKYKPESTDAGDKDAFRRFKISEIDKEFAISSFKKEPLSGEAGRKVSEIRIYCDDDDRWELAPDNEETWEKDQLPVNSKRPRDKQEWDDKKNQIRTLGLPACKYNKERKDKKLTLMSTYGSEGSFIGQSSDEEPFRTTVSICPAWLDDKKRRELVSQIPEKKKLGGVGRPTMKPVDAFQYIGSMVMYHEFHHHMRYQLVDHAYGWKKCYALNRDKASENADTFSMFGILMWGLERKFALDPDKKADGVWGKKDEDIPDRVKSASKRELAARPISCKDETLDAGEEGLLCKDFKA